MIGSTSVVLGGRADSVFLLPGVSLFIADGVVRGERNPYEAGRD